MPPLTIVIAGAGIAGATAAIALVSSGQGHDVTLYERRHANDSALTTSNSIIQLQPNAIAVLKHLNLLRAIDAVSFDSRNTDFRDYTSGATIHLADLTRRGGVRVGTRGDIKDALVSEAGRRGVKVVTGIGVDSGTESASHATVMLSYGISTKADLVIGADGAASRVRRSLFPAYQPAILPWVVYQVHVPEDVIHTHQCGSGEMDRHKGAFQLWPCPGRLSTGSPSYRTQMFDLQLIDGNAPLEQDEEPELRTGWVESAATKSRPLSRLPRHTRCSRELL